MTRQSNLRGSYVTSVTILACLPLGQRPPTLLGCPRHQPALLLLLDEAISIHDIRYRCLHAQQVTGKIAAGQLGSHHTLARWLQIGK